VLYRDRLLLNLHRSLDSISLSEFLFLPVKVRIERCSILILHPGLDWPTFKTVHGKLLVDVDGQLLLDLSSWCELISS